MRPVLFLLTAFCAVGSPSGAGEYAAALVPQFRLVDESVSQDLFVWKDVCNVYVFRDGENALLVDLGDGSVLDHLSEIGVKKVEWVLLTHHHREQCLGYARIKDMGVRVGAPEAERG